MNTPAPPALTDCDREPIHTPGAVQPFGALIAVGDDMTVAHCSANVAEMLGLAAVPMPGTPLAQLIDPAAIDEVALAATVLAAADQVERLFDLPLRAGQPPFDCAVHRAGDLLILEFEPADATGSEAPMRTLQPMMRQLGTIEDTAALCAAAADRMKALLGFDRVMVYRFLPDDSGEVIAEARGEDVEPYLGLRYPRGDIPQQARALYLRSRLRIIADVDAVPVPIVPGVTREGEPIDLSMSTLRAVSPVHLTYLRNMGVAASLSISIIVRGKLWGLFACHHLTPRPLSYALRTAAELFSELFSLLVERGDGRARAALEGARDEMNAQLLHAVEEGGSLAAALPALRTIIARALPHDGASALIDGEYRADGAAPVEAEFRAIVPALAGAGTGKVLATEVLADKMPLAAGFAERAAGALVIPVSRWPADYVVLWRKPQSQTVTWAGDPGASHDPQGGHALTPRHSFAAWRQSVEGRAQPWTDGERDAGEGLRLALLDMIQRLADESREDRARAAQHQELLIAELNHRMRNILNLIRGLVNQTRHEAMDVEAFAAIVGGRIGALADAHANLTRENSAPAALHELIASEAQAYLSDKLDRLTVTGDSAAIAPEAYTVLALVIHEMMTNSVKYGSLCDQTGQLAIDVRCGEDGLTIRWQESGGPPVRQPERRGFGSTIIEQSIPFELDGKARIAFHPEGIEAEFWIPARFVTCQPGAAPSLAMPTGAAALTAPADADTAGGAGRRVLLVEDSMLIALDTEECLRSLGAQSVVVEGTVASALAALDTGGFDLALLDYNLGAETCEPVAQALAARAIPFWLATGYGEMADQLDAIGAQGLLVKPYGRDELTRIMRAPLPRAPG